MAPEPTLSCSSVPNRVLSVVLREGEEVRWIWTTGPDGEYVSGYTILRNRLPRKHDEPALIGAEADGVDSFHRAEALRYLLEGDHSSAGITSGDGIIPHEPAR